MALNVGTAVFTAIGNFAPLIASSKGASAALGETAVAAKGVGGAIPRGGGSSAVGMAAIGARAATMSDSMAGVGKKMTVGLTLPIVGIGVAAVKSFASFEDAMTQSTAIMGNLSETMKTNMADVARDVAKNSIFSATQVASAYYFLASAGLSASQSIAVMPEIVKFATAGMFDLATATTLSMDAQSALGLKSANSATNLKNLTRVTDVLVKANVLSNATTEQFSKAITMKAGSRMKALNISIESGVAVLSAFADAGIKGAKAGSTYDSVLRDLTVSAVKHADVYKKLGIAVFDAHGNMRDMAAVTGDFEHALGGMSAEAKVKAFNALGLTAMAQTGLNTLMLAGSTAALKSAKAFGTIGVSVTDAAGHIRPMSQIISDLQAKYAKLNPEQQKAFLSQAKLGGSISEVVAAIGGGQGKITQYEKALLGASGTTADVAARQMQSAGNKIKESKHQIDDAMLTVGADLLPFVVEAAKAIAKIADGFAHMSPFAQHAIIVFALLLAALGPVLLVLSKIIKAFGLISTMAGKIRGKGSASTGATTASATGVGGRMQVFWETSMPVHITGGSVETQDGKGGSSGANGSAKGALTGNVQSARIAGALDAAEYESSAATNVGRGGRLKTATGKLWSGMKGTAGRAGGAAAGGAVMSLMSGGSAGDAAKMAGITGGLELAMEGMSKVAQKVGPLIAGAFKKAGPAIADFASSAASALGGTAKGASGFLKTAVEVGGKWIWMGIQSLIGAAQMAAAWIIGLGPIGWIIIAVVALVALIALNWDRIKKYTIEAWNAIWAWIQSVVGWVVNFVKDHWLLLVAIIGGPLALMIGLVIKYWTQIKQFISTALSDIWNVMTGIFAKITGAWASLWGGLTGAFQAAWTGTLAAIKSAIGAIVGVINLFITGANWILGKLPGGLKIPTIPGFVEGGAIRGAGSGTSDSNIVRVSDGEHILTADDVKAAGGHGAIYAYRKSLHGFAGGGPIDFLKSAASAVGGAVSGAASALADKIKSGIGSVISATLGAAESPVKAAIAAMPEGLLKSLIGGVFSSIDSAVSGAVTTGQASAQTASMKANTSGAGTGGGAARWLSVVLAVLKALGQPANLAAGVLRRINFESGGNPMAINLTDSNAIAGHPSQGLVQTIPSTFAAYAGPYRSKGINDPFANIYAGMAYAISRYGSVAAVDPLVRPMGYDMGGVMQQGLTAVWNGTGGKEHVQSPEQSVVIASSIQHLGELEASLVASTTALMHVVVPSMTAPGAHGGGSHTEFHTTIQNPVPEKAGDSLARTYAKIAYLGLDAKGAI